jgi:CheY-like chemotaxis protein
LNSSASEAQAYLDVGFKAVLSKPFDQQALKECLQQLLAGAEHVTHKSPG